MKFHLDMHLLQAHTFIPQAIRNPESASGLTYKNRNQSKNKYGFSQDSHLKFIFVSKGYYLLIYDLMDSQITYVFKGTGTQLEKSPAVPSAPGLFRCLVSKIFRGKI